MHRICISSDSGITAQAKLRTDWQSVTVNCVTTDYWLVANAVIPDHDAKVFYPPLDTTTFSKADVLVQILLGGFRRWDAVYFIHIAQYGYTYENCVAFFPGFPLAVFSIAKPLSFLGVLHFHSWLLVTAFCLNSILFASAAVLLYNLSKDIFEDEKRSVLSSFLFCINPANVFMSAPYSETLHIFILINVVKCANKKSHLASSVFVGLCVLTRSNGLINAGFVLHSLAQSFVSQVVHLKSQNKKTLLHRCILFFTTFFNFLALTPILIFFCIIPFFIYQYYIYKLFCFPSVEILPAHLIAYGRAQGFRILGDSSSPWCNYSVPISYSYIQTHHWSVGFLKYYEFKQIPNFLLASPVVVLSFISCWHFYKLHPECLHYLGLVDFSQEPNSAKLKMGKAGCDNGLTDQQLAMKTAVFVFHLLGLTIFGCCFVHIQVLTRMLFSSSPLLYWYVATVLAKDKDFSSLNQNSAEISKDPKNDLKEVDTKGVTSYDIETLSFDTAFDAETNGKQKLFGSGDFEQKSGSLHRRHKEEDFHPSLPKAEVDFCVNAHHSNICLHVSYQFFNKWSSLSLGTQIIFIYFVSYSIIGTFMFCNFLPWT